MSGTVANQMALIASGVLLSFHWFAFFHSIQLSTVAVGVIGFSTYPVFVTFLEPLFVQGNPSPEGCVQRCAGFPGAALRGAGGGFVQLPDGGFGMGGAVRRNSGSVHDS